MSTSGDARDYIQLQIIKKKSGKASSLSTESTHPQSGREKETEKESAKEMHRKRKCDPVRSGQEKKEEVDAPGMS